MSLSDLQIRGTLVQTIEEGIVLPQERNLDFEHQEEYLQQIRQEWYLSLDSLYKLKKFLYFYENSKEVLDPMLCDSCIICGLVEKNKLTVMSKKLLICKNEKENICYITKNAVLKSKNIQNIILNNDTLSTLQIVCKVINKKDLLIMYLLKILGVVVVSSLGRDINIYRITDKNVFEEVKESIERQNELKNVKWKERIKFLTELGTIVFKKPSN